MILFLPEGHWGLCSEADPITKRDPVFWEIYKCYDKTNITVGTTDICSSCMAPIDLQLSMEKSQLMVQQDLYQSDPFLFNHAYKKNFPQKKKKKKKICILST